MKRLGRAIMTIVLELAAIVIVIIALPTIMIFEFFERLADEVRK